jgi:small conductance mechanosensitive channel
VTSFDSIDWVRIATILAIGIAAWFGVRRLEPLLRAMLVHGGIDSDAEKRWLTLVRAMRYIVGTAVALIVLMLLLDEVGISIAPLLGAAGIAGVAVGLAAQTVARDFLRGFALLLDNQLRVGDLVEIAGKTGTVEEVTLRYVRLRENDDTVHFIRTGEVNTVTNRSLSRRHPD